MDHVYKLSEMDQLKLQLTTELKLKEELLAQVAEFEKERDDWIARDARLNKTLESLKTQHSLLATDFEGALAAKLVSTEKVHELEEKVEQLTERLEYVLFSNV